MSALVVLLLGGTAESRALAAALRDEPGIRVVSSLAGRTADPAPVAGEVRTGGFGGEPGLRRWIADHGVGAVVDATHPFATRISAAARRAARACGVPLLGLRRPEWRPGPGDDWREVDSLEQAAELAPRLGRRVLLTVGRQGLAPFAARGGARFLARCVDAPSEPPPAHITLLLDRGPFPLDAERRLLAEHAVDVLVTKNSGGRATAAKLRAAREAGIPVVMVRRPDVPGGADAVDTVERAVAWVRAHAG